MAANESLTLASNYDAAGTNVDGSAYSGTVTVEIISNTTFAIHWSVGGEEFTGFGMRRDDALAATYMIDGEPGLMIYQIDSNGVMHGLWAVRGQDGNGTERLTPRD